MGRISELLTPACLIERPKMVRNAQHLKRLADKHHLPLRPHVKTLKSLQAAQLYAPYPSAITVSTLAEARYFAAAGYQDILYAVGLTPNKLPVVRALLDAGVKLTVVVDNEQAAGHLIQMTQDLTRPLRVALEVDVDGHRAGLKPDDAQLVALAQRISAQPQLRFQGLMAHAGASYSCFDEASRTSMATQEWQGITSAAALLLDAGIDCPMVSLGSTPTAFADIPRPGVTELRAGVYATFDCVMAGLGVCAHSDIAMSVLTTVIGHQHDKGWVLVDAGWMALSRDQGTASHPRNCGYGLVCDAQGNLLEGWYVAQTNQEHGIIRHVDDKVPPADIFEYGTTLRILPIHACSTAAQFEHYHVTDDNQTVSAVWSKVNGW